MRYSSVGARAELNINVLTTRLCSCVIDVQVVIFSSWLLFLSSHLMRCTALRGLLTCQKWRVARVGLTCSFEVDFGPARPSGRIVSVCSQPIRWSEPFHLTRCPWGRFIPKVRVQIIHQFVYNRECIQCVKTFLFVTQMSHLQWRRHTWRWLIWTPKKSNIFLSQGKHQASVSYCVSLCKTFYNKHIILHPLTPASVQRQHCIEKY